VTPEEREARTAAYWKEALAGADPEHWDAILWKTTPMSQGSTRMSYGYSEDALDRILLDDPQVGEDGGHTTQYRLGERVEHLRRCQYLPCGIRFLSKCPTAKYCSRKCRQRKPIPELRLCLVCGTPLELKHRDARFHPECRFRGYRALQNIDTVFCI